MREFAKLGLTRSVGGVLGLALARELTPVITSIIIAGAPAVSAHPAWWTWCPHRGQHVPRMLPGRVGSAFAAELGTMAVSEQTDSLRVLGSDPVDYLISPRVVACMIATPVLCLLCFCMGEALTAASGLSANLCRSLAADSFAVCRNGMQHGPG